MDIQHLNKALRFNLGLEPCHYKDLYINDIYSVLTDDIIGDGYFYLQWLFPAQGTSRWHTHTTVVNQDDVEFMRRSNEIKRNIINSTAFMFHYFQLDMNDNLIVPKETINDKTYWLRGIGHEERKLSRMMLGLKLCGFDELAQQLQQLSITLLSTKGFKTG